jgi:DICT domain-containing protein
MRSHVVLNRRMNGRSSVHALFHAMSDLVIAATFSDPIQRTAFTGRGSFPV